MPGEDRYVNRGNYVDGDTKPTGGFIGQELLATNGSAWEWTGTQWVSKGRYGGNGALLYGVNYDQTGIIPIFADDFSNNIVTIEQEHSKIHQGKLFTIAQRLVIDDAGGAAPTHEFLGVVPAAIFPHFRQLIVTTDGSGCDVDFYEGTTVSANGSAVTAYNNNRNSSTTPDLDIYDGPTVTDDGTLLEPILITGTRQAGSSGSDGSNEWDLKVSTNYMIRITNNTAGAGSSNFVINMFWYE